MLRSQLPRRLITTIVIPSGAPSSKEQPSSEDHSDGVTMETATRTPLPHRMRIASGGSISNYVQFALQFLRDNPTIPLVLHTLPPAPKSDTSPSKSGGADLEEEPDQHSHRHQNGASTSTPSPSTTFLPCTLAIPRLISVVEIIKRSYIAELKKDAQRQLSIRPNRSEGTRRYAGKAKGKEKEKEKVVPANVGGRGIWQYTESGLYTPTSPHPCSASSRGVEEAMGDGAAEALARVLGGRTKPKMTHHPCMQITLSTQPLGLEDPSAESSTDNGHGNGNVTVQYILAKKKVRGKRKSKGKATRPADVSEAEGGASADDAEADADGGGVVRMEIDEDQVGVASSSRVAAPSTSKGKAKAKARAKAAESFKTSAQLKKGTQQEGEQGQKQPQGQDRAQTGAGAGAGAGTGTKGKRKADVPIHGVKKRRTET